MVLGTASRVTGLGRNILAPEPQLAAKLWADVSGRPQVAGTIPLLKKAVLLSFPRNVLAERV